MSDLTFLSATSMAEQIRQKKLSPVELVEAHLAKIARLNPQLNDCARLAQTCDQGSIRRRYTACAQFCSGLTAKSTAYID